jgi:hypothetical protein
MSSSRELHIAPGGSAAGLIKQAFNLPPGELVVHDDLLSCGPLIPLRNLNQWQRNREKYLRTLYPGDEFPFGDAPYDVLTNPERLREAESVTLWIGTGLAEQLLLALMPQLFRLFNADLKKLRVIQFAHDPVSGEEIQGIGLLNPDKLKAHPAASPLDEVALASLDRAWSAVTASTPDRLVAFLAADPGPLPFLQRSLQWLMFRFPDVERGVNSLEVELLTQVAEKGPTAAKVVGFTIIRWIDGLDYVGDAYLFSRLKGLAAPSQRRPLVALTGNPLSMRETEVALTQSGRAVLEGRANSVALNGIDDWVGGIHLNSATGKVWFQREGVLVDNASIG